MKDTYFDQNRLMDETDRRFHATKRETAELNLGRYHG